MPGSRFPFLAVLALCLALAACGPDPVDRLKAVRVVPDPSRTLEQVLGSYPHFSRVGWSTYPGRNGESMARVTGIFNLDSLVGKAGGGRIFSGRDRAVLDKAKINLCYVLEYAFTKDAPQGVRTRMELLLTSMDWDRSAPLQNEDILAEIARGVAGEATIKAVIDAADYCRSRPASAPGRHGQ
ncbi:hypothetical protein [Fundidesulfovibrio terrae]|uniref:hypothetical protein n=1 Tax=Fundidesulfovibrio terrae TaxID=2922866 RepID=UPI001FB027DB|nr:hypothetical protein [Fundidesulfovibrio terrae]